MTAAGIAPAQETDAKARASNPAADANAHAVDDEAADARKSAGDSRRVERQNYPGTEIEVKEFECLALALKHERASLVQRRQRLLTSFDASLRELRREKSALEYECKTADIKQLVLLEELRQLKLFEKREKTLLGKIEERDAEKTELENKVFEIECRVEEKAEELAVVTENKRKKRQPRTKRGQPKATPATPPKRKKQTTQKPTGKQTTLGFGSLGSPTRKSARQAAAQSPKN